MAQYLYVTDTAMDASTHLTLIVAEEAETDALGNRLSRVLGPGDLVTLTGPLGVGKSHLSRAVIRGLLQDPLAEVPSPSYTLVNVYQAGALEIWHADLFRLGDASELTEIGLEDAVSDALVLVEWPDRWSELPIRRMDLELAFADGDARQIKVDAHGPGWQRTLDIMGARE